MAASAGDSHPIVIYNARYRVMFPILDADGDLVTGATGLDSELSQDQGTFADATNEATEIATSSGMYYLDLIATELDTKSTTIIVKTSSVGAKTTPIVLNPVRMPQLRTGTAQAGAATTITLDSGASAADNFYNGCYVNITNNSPSNVLGQARCIVSYVGSTKVATVCSAWGTNPSSASTFEILLPGAAGVVAWAGAAVVDPNTAGYPISTIKDGTGTGEIDTTSGGVLVAAIAANAITATAIATDAIGAAELAADAVTEIAAGIGAAVNAEVVDALNVDTYAELAAVPAATATLTQMVRWLFLLARNKFNQTATTAAIRNDADAGNVAVSTVSDDGVTFVRSEWS